MKVITFSDAHYCSRDVGLYFGYPDPNYDRLKWLIGYLFNDPPDVVVNLGDFTEQYHDTEPPPLPIYDQLRGVVDIVKIAGNHDPRDGAENVVIDGITYEHGHRGGKMRNVGRVREFYQGQRVIHGHTHHPFDGWAFDTGSITMNGTYAVIVDGVPELRQVP